MLPNPYTGAPMGYVWCSNKLCRRELIQTHQGPRWIKTAMWCQDAECDAPTFVMVQHPRHRHLMPLFPTPTATVASLRVGEPDASGNYSVTYQYFCAPACAPALGAVPRYPREMDGQPHPDNFGPCVALQRAADFHRDCFTDERGQHYRDWLGDELHLRKQQIATLMQAWERSRG